MRFPVFTRASFFSLWALIFATLSALALAQQVGQPVTGSMGITMTVDALSQRGAQTATVDAATTRIRPVLRADRRNLPGNPQSPPRTTSARTASIASNSATTPAAVAVSTSFTGATLSDVNAFPPDTMGAVGPSQFIVAVNGRLRSFNKTTGGRDNALDLDMNTFFLSVMTPVTGSITSNFASDPHIRYDRLSGRWMVVMIDVPNGGSAANRILLAVSSGSTITGTASFTFFQFSAVAVGTGVFADYPTLGIDLNALYIGVNMFTSTGAFAGTEGYVVKKSSILTGGPIVSTAFTLLADATSAGPVTPQGVDNYSTSSNEGYFIGVDNASFGTLMIRRVSTPGGTPTISGNISLTVPLTTTPITVPHLNNTGGSNGNLDGSDDRLYAAHLRNGRLWTAHAIQVDATGAQSSTGGRNGTRWYEIQNLTATPALVQSGTVFDSAAANPLSYWMPTVVVSGQGHAYLGFSSAGANAFANAAATARWVGDAPGTMQSPVAYTASTTAYNPASNVGGASGRRWGDYSYTSLDPEDDMTVWTIQEFCDVADSFGVRVAKLLAPPPPPTLAASPSTLASAQPSVNIVITGTGITAAAGQGFYDPGSGFAKRLTSSIPGLVVNTVTYTNATSITVNVSTVNATAGSKNVTVTNPDGQAVTATGLLTITVVNSAPVITSAASTTFATGATGSFLVTTTGSPTPAETRTGATLPSGVSFVDNGNGTASLSGTPAAGTGGTYALSIAAANGVPPNATQTFTLTVNQPPAFTSNSPTGTGVVGTAYSHTFAASGFPATFSYSVSTGTLPNGLSLASGVVSGTPTAAGTFAGTVSVSNGVSPTAAQNFSIVISRTPQTISFPTVTAFSWYQGSATLAATASSNLAVTYSVVSGPCSVAGSTLTASGPGSCVVAADQPGNATFASAVQQTPTVTVNVGPALLDIDGSGTTTRYDAGTDGIMVLRFLLGFTAGAIDSGARGATATRNSAQISTQLTTIQTLLDIDGDGILRAPTDGLLIVRYMLGLRGNTLVAGVSIGTLTTTQIEARISRLMP